MSFAQGRRGSLQVLAELITLVDCAVEVQLRVVVLSVELRYFSIPGGLFPFCPCTPSGFLVLFELPVVARFAALKWFSPAGFVVSAAFPLAAPGVERTRV